MSLPDTHKVTASLWWSLFRRILPRIIEFVLLLLWLKSRQKLLFYFGNVFIWFFWYTYILSEWNVWISLNDDCLLMIKDNHSFKTNKIDEQNWMTIASLRMWQNSPGVDFINILCTNFLYEHCFSSFFYVHVTREKLPIQCSYKKFAPKMLMKLTTADLFRRAW
jgi:hypothetical protein